MVYVLTSAFRFIASSTIRVCPLSIRADLHFSASSYRWYKPYFYRKVFTTLPTKKEYFAHDWEHLLYEPSNPESISPVAEQLPEFQKLDEKWKTMLSYRFRTKEEEFTDQLNAKLVELGYHSTEISTGATVIRLTMLLRAKKRTAVDHPKNLCLRFAIRALIRRRQRQLRLLRATNMAEFKRLTEALQITGYEHPDPYKLPDTDPVVKRKLATRSECYQMRLTKLAKLKMEFVAIEKAFYKNKEAQLNKMLQDLTILDEPQSEGTGASNLDVAQRRLEALFQEVVKERQNETLIIPESDRLEWYFREAVGRERYAARLAEKARKQSLRKR